MLGRQIALGDGDKAGQSRFRGEQIVEIAVERSIVDAVTDRQQLAVGIEQEAELHCIEHRLGTVGEGDEPLAARVGAFGTVDLVAPVHQRRAQCGRPDKDFLVAAPRHRSPSVISQCIGVPGKIAQPGRKTVVGRFNRQRSSYLREIGKHRRGNAVRRSCRTDSLGEQSRVILDASRPARSDRRPGGNL